MKYFVVSLLFLLNSEIVSLIALNIMVLFFFGDCLKEWFF